jgi:inosine-uridine nucleoside N-ribohydrolase
VFGNHSDLELLATNACRVLHMAGDVEIPIYKGCSNPVVLFPSVCVCVR